MLQSTSVNNKAILNFSGLWCVVFLLFSTLTFGQEKKVETKIDTTRVTFGTQMTLTLRTNVDTLSRVKFPEGNFFGSLEVLEDYPTDTLKEKDRYQLIKRYGLTQWDSGSYTIPRLEVVINDKKFYSDSLRVEIIPVAIDTIKQPLFDIKDIQQASSSFKWWLWLLIVLGVLGIGYMVYYLIKKRKKPLQKEEVVYTSPIDKATSQLKKLEQKQLIERGEIKGYYSELTDIARTYIEEVMQVPAMESTTSELIVSLKKTMVKRKISLTPETLDNLEKVLKQADLVKFAKSKPLEFEILADREKIEKSILTIDASLPEEIEEEEIDNEELQRQLLLKKKRKQQRTLIGMVGVLIFTGLLVFFVARFGMDYVREHFIGYEARGLYEGTWVTSEYGYPPVTIETPKVLKRQDNTLLVPEKVLNKTKDLSIFSFGSLTDPIHIMITHMTFPEGTEIDVESGIEKAVMGLETRGVQVQSFLKDDFTVGVYTGSRASGRCKIIDGKDNLTSKYEFIYLNVKETTVQILVLTEENNEFAQKIGERAIESIQIQDIKQP